jgi:hypothetical protein
VPGLSAEVALWRDLLAVVAAACAWLEVRGRREAAVAMAALLALLSTGFWTAALARPYGVLVDPATTRWAADVAVAGWAGGEDGFLVGERSHGGAWPTLARSVSPEWVIQIPTVLPAVVLPASTLLVAGLWRGRGAGLAAILWVGAGSTGLDTLRGTAFLPGIWPRPGPAVLWVLTVAVVLVSARLMVKMGAAAPSAAVVMLPVLAWTLLGRREPALGGWETLLALTLDQHLWLVAGGAGLWRERDRAALALVAGGAALVLARAWGGPGDAWAGAAFYRLGLLMGAAAWLDGPTEGLVPQGAGSVLRRRGLDPARLPVGIVCAVALIGSLVTWWDPIRTDPVARASTEPVPEALVETMAWLRAHTEREGSVLAHADYAPAVAVLGGRRVLRAPGLVMPIDEERRIRLERAVLTSEPPAPLVQRYGLRYVFLAPGQFREYGLEAAEDFERLGTARLLFANEKGMRLYELTDTAGRREAFK